MVLTDDGIDQPDDAFQSTGQSRAVVSSFRINDGSDAVLTPDSRSKEADHSCEPASI